MDELVEILKEKGYLLDEGPSSASVTNELSKDVERLFALSAEVEAAKLELHRLGSDAEFDDLVSRGAVEKKLKMLEAVQGRVAAVLAGKDKVLAFIQKQHSRGGQSSGLCVHVAHQESMQDLFRSLFEHLECMDRCIESMVWASSPSAAEARAQFDDTLASMTRWQAKYSRALELSESFTKFLE